MGAKREIALVEKNARLRETALQRQVAQLAMEVSEMRDHVIELEKNAMKDPVINVNVASFVDVRTSMLTQFGLPRRPATAKEREQIDELILAEAKRIETRRTERARIAAEQAEPGNDTDEESPAALDHEDEENGERSQAGSGMPASGQRRRERVPANRD